MPLERTRTIWRADGGAVAASYALALSGLVVTAGIGFDVAQVAALDTELQNAADQAALAAATQLDGSSNAISNATTAASGLVVNRSLMANDGGTSQVTVSGLTFYPTKADAEADTNATTTATAAKFVRVSLNTRRARYALTAVGGLIAALSPNIAARATAGMGSSLCKVPPVMMCNPNSDTTSFNVNNFIGSGILLTAHGSGGAYTSGDFGYLDVGAGASDLGKLLAYANPPGDCVDITQPTTQPGSMASVINDFNTRFDIFDNGDSNNCYGGSLCPPSDNSRKDVVQSGNLTTSSNFKKKDCGFGGGNGWQFSPNPYRPQSTNSATADLCSTTNKCSTLSSGLPDAMGFPRDLKHAWPNPNMTADRIGDGQWDINAYWQVNHGTAWSGQVATTVTGRAYPTRYEIYKWERANPGTGYRQFNSSGNYTDFQAPVCRPGLSPSGTNPDRRVIPVAVVNCSGLNGAAKVTPIDWIDVFLVEPSLNRGSGKNTYTNLGDIYVEVIGRNTQGAEGATSQVVRRDKPYLVK